MRPHKRTRLTGAAFINIEAEDARDNDDDISSPDGSLADFLDDVDVDNSRNETETNKYPAHANNMAKHELDALVASYREEALQLRAVARHHESTSMSLPDQELGVNELSFEGETLLSKEPLLSSKLMLFLVPTKIGVEIELGRRIQAEVLAPCKVLASSALLGRIYILAPSKRIARRQLRVVDCSEIFEDRMEQIAPRDKSIVIQKIQKASVVGDGGGYAPKQWVRLQCGPYKSEIGYVLKVLEVDMLLVAVIRKELLEEGHGTESGKRSFNLSICRQPTEPHPWSFDADSVWQDVDISKHPNSIQLLALYGIHAVTLEEPEASDLAFFTLLGFNTLRTTNRAMLQVGDRVEVIAGEIRGTFGTVEHTIGDMAKLIVTCSTAGHCPPSIVVHLCDIERLFDVGMMIRVRIGRHTGKTGYVMSSSGLELVILDECARDEFIVLKVFVQTTELRGRQFHLVDYKNGAILGKLVHVIELGIIGRVQGITKEGSVEIELSSNKGRKNIIFLPSEVVDPQTMLRLDGHRFHDEEKVKTALSRYLERRPRQHFRYKRWHSTHIDGIMTSYLELCLRPVPGAVNGNPVSSCSLSPSRTPCYTGELTEFVGQDVYIVKNIKRFGRLLTVNGNSHAIVLINGEVQPQVFLLNEVLSLRTFRCLDNTVVHDIDVIYDTLVQRTVKTIKCSPVQSDTNQNTPDDTAMSCSWVLNQQIQRLLKDHRIYFRFVDFCESPRNVAHMAAWTTLETSTRNVVGATPNSTEIFLEFKSREGKQYSDWILLSRLMNFMPKTVDNALIVEGPAAGRILPVERMDKRKGLPGGILLRESGSGRNKKLVSYNLSQVTKIQTL